ncbi:MAG: type I 3-dehydroquinate dehydratase [Acidobacteria bacterium]|nr:type I 3-dehydroquinate dehydratase [Acidobacteriota bacterium]
MICVSISDVSYKLAAEYARKYPFVEFRMETLPISAEEAATLFSIANKSIATCRPLPGQEERRKLLLKTGLKHGADFVDIEVDSEDKMPTEMRESLRKSGAKLIISYHNFKETPEGSMLREIYEKASEHDADIVKIACAVHTHEDNLRLLSLCVRYPSLLVIGMGPNGRLTRLLGPFLGSPFTFACPDEQPAVAPGQLPYSRMKQLQTQIQDIFHGEV